MREMEQKGLEAIWGFVADKRASYDVKVARWYTTYTQKGLETAKIRT